MSISDPFLLIILIVMASMALRWNRRDIRLQPDKFWSLVRSQEKPIVLLTTRGYLLKRLCYVFPYQGILFVTDAKQTEAPEGVTLIGTGDSGC